MFNFLSDILYFETFCEKKNNYDSLKIITKMEGKNAQESTEKSKVFQIPIEDFEYSMNTESAKEKKKEILELFTTYNKLRSKEEFDYIEDELHEACREGDLEMIKIFLSETIEDSTNTLKFKIDETNQTASLFKVENGIEEVNIPRTIEHESTEYLITSIIGFCADVKTVKFSEESAVKTFYRDAFFGSKIESIYFPSSLKELKEGWCNETKYLKRIIISPSNCQYEFKEDKYLVCKSDSNNDEFDKLLFVRRDIDEFSIPSNIKIISSSAFQHSNIKTIFIPSSVSKICDSAFSNCKNLHKVEIPTNSNLQTIESNAFYNSNIESIFIPSSVSKICKYAFSYCRNLHKVEIPTNSNLQTIESNAFYKSNIESIFIPSSVSKICKYAFSNCKNLHKVEIPTNSNLQTIKSFAFYKSNIESIFIPSSVSKICEYAFYNCENLLKVEIPTNSSLQIIESNAFLNSNIEEIFIPSGLKELKEGWCFGTENLTRITISPLNGQFKLIDNKYLVRKSDECNIEFDILLFACRDIKQISIPSISKISMIVNNSVLIDFNKKYMLHGRIL